MTMTNDEAVKVLADHNEWRRGNDDFPATNPTKLGLAIEVAIAALSAQEAAPPAQADILAEYELWAVRMMVAKTDELNDAAVDKLDSLWRKMTPEQRDQANETSARYSAELQHADTKQAEPCPWVRQSSEGTAYCELAESGAKQAEPLRVTRNRLYKAWNAMERASNAYEMLAVLHQLGAKVEVSDG